MIAVEVENLSFSYNSEPILQKIGFSVWRGDFIGIIGSNGAGKSTLLKLLLGQLAPDSGTICLLGEDVRRFRRWPQIGYVPQTGSSAAANFPATALEIVQANLFSQIGLMRSPKRQHLEQTWQALEQVGMQDYAKRLISTLSGGQLQRVMVARALVSQPEILLLDEPTSGIDSKSADSLYELLGRLNRQTGVTVLIVTHDLARIAEYAHRALLLEEGSLVELNRDQLADQLSFRHRHPAKAISG